MQIERQKEPMATSQNLSQFAERMRLRSLQVERGVDKIVKMTALAVDQAVVLGTPVDEGRARSNWIASIGSPVSETREPYSPGSKLGLGESGNASAAIAQGTEVIRASPPNTPIFITNNLSYIAKLNNGSSRQAPKNFVNNAVKQGAQQVSRVKIFEVQ